MNLLTNLYDQNFLFKFCNKCIVLTAYQKTELFQNQNSAKTTVKKTFPRHQRSLGDPYAQQRIGIRRRYKTKTKNFDRADSLEDSFCQS